MKNIYMIGGTMGVGKTTTCRILRDKLPDCVFLDGDWCWDMHPFQVTSETKKMVMKNICFLLNQFIHCSAYENIVFCWVMHEQEIIDEIMSNLEISGCRVHNISLVCSEEALRNRLLRDVDAGLRSEDVMERSIARLRMYEELDTEKMDISHMTPEQAALELMRIAAAV